MCKLVETAVHSAILLDEVLATHIEDRFIGEENGKLRIDDPAMKLIERTLAPAGMCAIRTSCRWTG